MPTVSVILNVRNGAATLSEAIESVLAQSFPDWELIIWDDGSTDDSARIAHSYVADPRILYSLSPEQTELGEARERAIRKATGEWIAFLDQDDIWLPTKLEKQLGVANSSEAVGMVYGRTVAFYPDGRQHDYDYAHEFTALPQGRILPYLFRDACFIAMSSAVMRRSAVEQVLPIPQKLQLIPDYYLYVAIARRHEVRAVQEMVCRYRVHDSSMTRTLRKRLYQQALWLMRNCSESVNPKLVEYRVRTNSTGLALEEMRSPETVRLGVKRLLQNGSLLWLASRPFVHAYRRLRRLVRTPMWARSD